MRDFDLQKAIEGHKLVTRDGREVTEFCYFKTCTTEEEYPVGAVIDGKLLCFKKNGSFGTGMDRDNNLFLKSEKKKKLYISIASKSEIEGAYHAASLAFESMEAMRKFYGDIEKTTNIVEVEIDV